MRAWEKMLAGLHVYKEKRGICWFIMPENDECWPEFLSGYRLEPAAKETAGRTETFIDANDRGDYAAQIAGSKRR
ncbi:hypothetical protein F441_02085 [Phytophthora nicotianae CJ01A1]|uniref:Uncharacterized protein n=1 Tax=Phytophthora nicotianae CJ01A1 TaxID=1317063 RepID=W2XRL2_PHYNI|nr:hypothetical protein F441_02085 [Phytophthora nicotianae CJ01A1]